MNDKDQGGEILKEYVEEPDSYWIDRIKEILSKSIATIDSASKQMMAVTGIVLGIYFHAMPIKEFQSEFDTVSRFLYLIPFFFWFLSLIWAFLAFAPQRQILHFTSEMDARRDIEEVSRQKFNLFKTSFIFFLLGILALIAALVHYFFFSGSAGQPIS